jgi:restriction system protein
MDMGDFYLDADFGIVEAAHRVHRLAGRPGGVSVVWVDGGRGGGDGGRGGMNSQQALAFLLDQVEGALQESLARHHAAAHEGDSAPVEIEVERQKSLISTRSQLQALQELWPELVRKRQQQPDEQPKQSGQDTSPHKKFGKRLPKGARTPQKAFVLPILTALEEMNGRGPSDEVLNIVEQLMSGTLNDFDYGRLKRGQLRWHNTAQWARQQMKDEGLLANDSPRGVWEITERGRTFLHEHSETNGLTGRETL